MDAGSRAGDRRPESLWADLDGPVHYVDHGGAPDGPLLVCVHGLGGSLLNWAALAPLLTLGIPVSSTTAILLAAFQNYNLQPEPALSQILGLAEVPTPDDTADALACAISIANAERPGERLNAGAARSAGAAETRAGDRFGVDWSVRPCPR